MTDTFRSRINHFLRQVELGVDISDAPIQLIERAADRLPEQFQRGLREIAKRMERLACLPEIQPKEIPRRIERAPDESERDHDLRAIALLICDALSTDASHSSLAVQAHEAIKRIRPETGPMQPKTPIPMHLRRTPESKSK